MGATAEKREVPVSGVRRWLEPGPIVLLTSHWQGRSNVMTMGWHTVMEFTPSLVGCVIAASNHSFAMIRGSGQCVINLPTVELLDTVVRVGNTSGAEVDKFHSFGLTSEPSLEVEAPAIAECHAHFECRLHDDLLVDRYNFFVFEVVRARVATAPEHPRTVHYLGGGRFMVAGEIVDRSALFRPDML
jgi:flavin reductase (DIM6/NTAB) family NADH-FMN oxidoreductase RutF